ncbi:hypothetical protein LEP3755_02500 [Leptolyngbya sp. NIES-3755]|nr:hypothetical protein LEP3755_02500 [Leptolyngbya sp. NIES-3755]
MTGRTGIKLHLFLLSKPLIMLTERIDLAIRLGLLADSTFFDFLPRLEKTGEFTGWN